MSRILVTGGAGFVGSHVVDELVEQGNEVVVVDALLAEAHEGAPDHLNPAAEYVVGSVLDGESVRRCLRGVDAVCHQAAMVGLGTDLRDAPAYVANNDLGTATLLATMYEIGFRGRLVLASSMVVYGEGRYRCGRHGIVRPPAREPAALRAGRFDPCCPACGRSLEPESIPEDAPLDPRNVYAATKVHQEHLCSSYSRETEVPVTTLRYHNVYGPRMPRDTPYAGVAGIFRSELEAGRAPRVFEDGRQTRDFVHVRDIAHANVLALLADPPEPGPFNIATGEPHGVGEMAVALADALGPDAPRPVVTGQFRLGDVRHVFASPDLARERLGFRSSVSFGDGIGDFARALLRTAGPSRGVEM